MHCEGVTGKLSRVTEPITEVQCKYENILSKTKNYLFSFTFLLTIIPQAMVIFMAEKFYDVSTFSYCKLPFPTNFL